MKVFGCTMKGGYCGGVILVAANNVEEAFLTASKNTMIDYWFEWVDKDGGWAAPFSESATLRSDWFPFECWKEYEHLSSDYKEPTLIMAEYYAE